MADREKAKLHLKSKEIIIKVRIVVTSRKSERGLWLEKGTRGASGMLAGFFLDMNGVNVGICFVIIKQLNSCSIELLNSYVYFMHILVFKKF